MDSLSVLSVVLLHAAFGCMFLYIHGRYPAVSTRLIAQSWLLEAVRAGILLHEFGAPKVFSHWLSAADCLLLLGNWWLFKGVAELMGVKLSARLGRYYLGIGVPLVLVLRYAAPPLVQYATGLPIEQAGFHCILVELTLLSLSLGVARCMMLYWFIRASRDAQAPGVSIAILFCIPYAVFGIMVPFQFYYGYFPTWIHFFWAIRVLGFSLGLLMLMFDKQISRLKEREKSYRTLVETTHDIIASVDAKGCWTFVNPAVERIYGYRTEEMLGRPFSDFMSKEQAEKDQATFTRMFDGKPLLNYNTVHLRKDGKSICLNYNITPIKDARGKVVGVLGTAQDITERLQTEQALRESLFKFQGILRAAPIGIGVAVNRAFTEVNDSLCQMLGYTRDELIGRNLRFLYATDEEYARVGREYAQMLGQSKGVVETRIVRKDGKVIDVILTAVLWTVSNP
jgi:two-component system, cell cycle sensor histidine kinase and response regulator CckA